MESAEDSAVADFLQILEEHRKNCERQVLTKQHHSTFLNFLTGHAAPPWLTKNSLSFAPITDSFC